MVGNLRLLVSAAGAGRFFRVAKLLKNHPLG